MANDFKRFAVTNVNTSSGASASAVYTVPAGSGSSALESIVIGITIANTSTAGITASVFLDNNSGSNDVHIVKNASIPAGSSLEVMAGNKLVLQNSGSAGDVLRVSASASNSADALVSVLEDV